MDKFLNDDFLLENQTAKTLFHEYAKDLPIYDFHTHLPVKEIYDNKNFDNITQIWLGGDHYKWRLMRANGIDEKYITGDASDKEKFMKWAETVPYTIGNPLYVWTHLELRRYFGISDKLLNVKNSKFIYDECNRLLRQDDFSVRSLIEKMNVKVICTTDDPLDSLEYHIALNEDLSFKTQVLPTFRPDKAIYIEDPTMFNKYITQLEEISNVEINNFNSYMSALQERIEFFNSNGCRISDHGMEQISFSEFNITDVEEFFTKLQAGKSLKLDEIIQFKTATYSRLAKTYHKLNWTMQIHVGAIRNTNTNKYAIIGPDTGYDTIGDHSIANLLSKFLNFLEKDGFLPKTIIYPINPNDFDTVVSLIGSFQNGNTPGKLQLGSAWWFNDQKTGIEKQLTAVANNGLLSRFVGMLTDSRSFLSYPRHEYFKRILCNLLGNWVDRGEIPNDIDLLGNMVQNISFNNANNYFK